MGTVGRAGRPADRARDDPHHGCVWVRISGTATFCINDKLGQGGGDPLDWNIPSLSTSNPCRRGALNYWLPSWSSSLIGLLAAVGHAVVEGGGCCCAVGPCNACTAEGGDEVGRRALLSVYVKKTATAKK